MTPDLLQVGLDRALIAYFGTAFDVDPTSAEYREFLEGWNGAGLGAFTNVTMAGVNARTAYEREVANAAAALESESTASGE